jgi:protein-disulfide isomerase
MDGSAVHTTAMSESPRLVLPVSARDHARGPEGAPVTLVEYGDFECPHCGAAYPVLSKVRQQYADRVRFVFRHFPLTNVHPHAQAAAEASEWAAAQGRFWELHDRIYQTQNRLSEPHLLRLAEELQLDADSLARTLKDHLFFSRVKEDFLGGIKSGVKGTPAYFLNEVRHEGDASTLQGSIEALLAGG